MRVKAKMNVKHHPYYLTKDDVVTVDDENGAIMVKNGWVENVDTGESVEPARTESTLDVHSSAHSSRDSN